MSPSIDASILAPDLARKVRRLCYRGYQYYDEGDFQLALRTFYQAWLAVPKPQSNWREAGWVLTAIGDAYFRLGKYEQACEALASALRCPGAERSPFAYLRFGQALYESEQIDQAQDVLRKAAEMGGSELFAREDAKYRRLVSAAL